MGENGIKLGNLQQDILCALVERGPSTKNEIKKHLMEMDHKTDYKAVHTAFEGLFRRELIGEAPQFKKTWRGQTYGQYWLTRRGQMHMVAVGTMEQTEKIVRVLHKMGTSKDTTEAILLMKRTLPPDTLKLELKAYDGQEITSIPLPSLNEDASRDFLTEMVKNPTFGEDTKKALRKARMNIDELLEEK